jgi:hypothetical protein
MCDKTKAIQEKAEQIDTVFWNSFVVIVFFVLIKLFKNIKVTAVKSFTENAHNPFSCFSSSLPQTSGSCDHLLLFSF